MSRLSAEEYRTRHGATTGDRIRLGDTDLWVRVAEDRTARGDEPIWGYAKNLRMRIAQNDTAAGPSELDVVLTGALVIDPVVGVVKADIGIKDGRIVGIGRAGSPDISDGIDLVVGPHTKPYMAYGLIATPGGVDSHVHTIDPELLPPALSGGVTTLITAGFEEPPYAMERVLAGLEGWPVNVGIQAGARAMEDRHLDTMLAAGATGFKVHEDNGAYPDLIDYVLRYADERDVKAGFPAWGPLGEGNASLERAEPTRYRRDWAGAPHAAPTVSLTFVSALANRSALARRLATRRTLVAVSSVRGLTRASLHANRATVPVEIDVRTGAVSLDGRPLAVAPVSEVPLSRRYLLR